MDLETSFYGMTFALAMLTKICRSYGIVLVPTWPFSIGKITVNNTTFQLFPYNNTNFD